MPQGGGPRLTGNPDPAPPPPVSATIARSRRTRFPFAESIPMKRLALVAGACLALLLCLPSAWAQKNSYTLAVGVPVNYHFTKDQTTNTAPDAKSPSGYRIMLETPIHLGLGYAQYKSGFKNPSAPYSNRDITYRLLEVQATANFDAWLIGLGYGTGKAAFDPVSAGGFDFADSKAHELYVLLGFMLGQNWDLRLSYHALVVNAELTFGGATTIGDIGALMGVLGVGYHY
jgi:hypothetical protein